MSLMREARRSSRQALEKLLRLRDEVNLQAHLMSLEARQLLWTLQGQVSALEQRAEREGDHAVDAIQGAARELTRALDDLMTEQFAAARGTAGSVRALMTTRVRTCTKDDTLNTAAHLMWTEDCGVLPVVSPEGKVVGVVTDRDVCMAAYFQGRPLAQLSVESAMSKKVSSCGPDDSLESALGAMTEQSVRRLPVTDGEGNLLGILSIADVARWASLASATTKAALVEALAIISSQAPQSSSPAEPLGGAQN